MSAVESGKTTDALEKQIFRYTVASITEELEINITRTAYSPLIQEAQDYCIALMTPDFRPFMQSQASIPIFMTDMGEPVRDCVSIIGVEKLQAGDVFVTNYRSGQHINNVTLATPLFHGDRLTGYLAIRAHWADLGGLAPGGQSMASRSIFHDGTRYRGLRLMRGGELVPEVMATIQANTWQIEALTGDAMAQLSACVLGATRWQERVATRWSADEVSVLVEAQLKASEALARRAIAALPDGTYACERPWQFSLGGVEIDTTLRMKLIVDGDRMICDLSGMPPETDLPINAGSAGGGMAAVKLAFRYLAGGDAPADAGFFDALEVILPEGTIVSAKDDAPMAFWNMAISTLIDMFYSAIGTVHPELVPASHGGVIGAVMFAGKRPDGSWWRYVEGSTGGLGADQESEGYGPVQTLFTGNMKNIPVEVIEGRYPLRIRETWLDRDAGGDGLHRGGPACGRLFETLTDCTFDAYPQPVSPAPGLAGGGAGRPGTMHIKKPGCDAWTEPGGAVPAGTLIRQIGQGGGGWGTPRSHGANKDDGKGKVA